MKKTSVLIVILCLAVCFSYPIFTSFPQKAEAAAAEKAIKCYRCGKSFTIPADRHQGICLCCGAKYVIPKPTPTPDPNLVLATGLSSYAGSYGSYGEVPLPIPVPEPESISWMSAASYIGQTKTVKGTIIGGHLSSRSGNLYLNFSPNYQTSLSIKIPKESVSKFPSDAMNFYQGKTVYATGRIEKDRYLRLIVLDPSDLKVAE